MALRGHRDPRLPRLLHRVLSVRRACARVCERAQHLEAMKLLEAMKAAAAKAAAEKKALVNKAAPENAEAAALRRELEAVRAAADEAKSAAEKAASEAKAAAEKAAAEAMAAAKKAADELTAAKDKLAARNFLAAADAAKKAAVEKAALEKTAADKAIHVCYHAAFVPGRAPSFSDASPPLAAAASPSRHKLFPSPPAACAALAISLHHVPCTTWTHALPAVCLRAAAPYPPPCRALHGPC